MVMCLRVLLCVVRQNKPDILLFRKEKNVSYTNFVFECIYTGPFTILNKYLPKLGPCSTYACHRPQWRD